MMRIKLFTLFIVVATALAARGAWAQEMSGSSFSVDEGQAIFGGGPIESAGGALEGSGAIVPANLTISAGSNYSVIGSAIGASLPTDPPSPPTSASKPAALGVTTQTISWTASASDEVETYEVFRKAAGESDYTYLDSVSASDAAKYEDDSATFGTTYVYKVVAVDVGMNRSETAQEITSTLYMPGDADKNGTIIAADILSIFFALGEQEGDDEFDPAIDSDRNGVIELDDILYIAYNYRAKPSTFDAGAIENANSGRHAALVENYRVVLDALSSMDPSPERDELINKIEGYIVQGENGAAAKLNLAAGWSLLGLPFKMDVADFVAELNAKGAGQTAVYSYAGGGYSLLNDANGAAMEPGRGYFIRLDNPASVILEGDGEQQEASEVKIALEPGWNLLGNPLPFSASGEMGGRTSGLSIYQLSDSKYRSRASVGLLEPLQGFWLFSETAGTLTVSR